MDIVETMEYKAKCRDCDWTFTHDQRRVMMEYVEDHLREYDKEQGSLVNANHVVETSEVGVVEYRW